MCYRAVEMNDFNMNIHDLYVTNITRVYKNHHELATLLMDFINDGIVKENMQQELGFVVGVKIPKYNLKQDSVRTSYGYIRFAKYQNHEKAAKWLNGVYFHGRQLHVEVNNTPTAAAQWPTMHYLKKSNDKHYHKEKKIDFEKNVKDNFPCRSELYTVYNDQIDEDHKQNNEPFEIVESESSIGILEVEEDNECEIIKGLKNKIEIMVSEELVGEIKNLKEQCGKSNEVVEDYRTKLTKIKNLLEVKEMTCSKQNKQYEELKYKVGVLEGEVNSLKIENCDKETALLDLKKQFKNLELENLKLKDEVKVKSTFIRKMVNMNSKLVNKYSEMVLDTLIVEEEDLEQKN